MLVFFLFKDIKREPCITFGDCVVYFSSFSLFLGSKHWISFHFGLFLVIFVNMNINVELDTDRLKSEQFFTCSFLCDQAIFLDAFLGDLHVC